MACLSRFLGGVLICLGASAICLAQFNSGIQGVVTDPSGGTIPDAKVRVVNTATGVAREVITLPDGLYRVLSLGPGSYSVTVEKTGFISARRDAVNLDVNLIVRMDVMLQLAGVTQEVSVRDRPPGVETEQARVSGLVDRAQLSELPINGRNIYNLVALQPGITGRSLLSSADTFATEFGPHANANGQRWEANSYTVDDTSVNAAYRAGNSNLVPSPESVQEVRVVSNNFSATDGRSPGGQVQVITKSGTNAFHGSALYYFRNNNLSSRTVFETAIPVFRKNQFGYSIGGPIVKNRVFFFTAYEGMRQSGGRTRQYTVETQALRDLIVQTRPNSIAAKLLRGFAPVSYPTFNLRDLGSPKPGVNVTGPADGIPDLGSVWYTPREMRDGNQINVRVDVELRPGKDRIYGNFFRNTLTSLTGGVRGAFDKGYDESSPYGNLNHTHTFGPSKLNEFRAGVSRIWGFPFYPASSSSRRELPNPEVPVVSIPSMSGFGISYYPLGWWQTSFQYKDTFTWVLASHTMKMGGELRRMRTSSINTNNYIPTYAFANVLDFADDEALQRPATLIRVRAHPPTISRRHWLRNGPASSTMIGRPRASSRSASVCGTRTSVPSARRSFDLSFSALVRILRSGSRAAALISLTGTIRPTISISRHGSGSRGIRPARAGSRFGGATALHTNASRTSPRRLTRRSGLPLAWGCSSVRTSPTASEILQSLTWGIRLIRRCRGGWTNGTASLGVAWLLWP